MLSDAKSSRLVDCEQKVTWFTRFWTVPVHPIDWNPRPLLRLLRVVNQGCPVSGNNSLRVFANITVKIENQAATKCLCPLHCISKQKYCWLQCPVAKKTYFPTPSKEPTKDYVLHCGRRFEWVQHHIVRQVVGPVRGPTVSKSVSCKCVNPRVSHDHGFLCISNPCERWNLCCSLSTSNLLSK